jgi:hypothetical protein
MPERQYPPGYPPQEVPGIAVPRRVFNSAELSRRAVWDAYWDRQNATKHHATTGDIRMSHTTQTPPAARRSSTFKHPFVTAGIGGILAVLAITVGVNLRKAESATPAQPLVSVQADCDPASGAYLQVTWTGFPTATTDATLTITDQHGQHPVGLPTDQADGDGIWNVSPGAATVTLTWPGVDRAITQHATVPRCERT